MALPYSLITDPTTYPKEAQQAKDGVTFVNTPDPSDPRIDNNVSIVKFAGSPYLARDANSGAPTIYLPRSGQSISEFSSNDAFTVDMWLRPDATGSNKFIFFDASSIRPVFELVFDTTCKLVITIDDFAIARDIAVACNNWDDGNWHHLRMAFKWKLDGSPGPYGVVAFLWDLEAVQLYGTTTGKGESWDLLQYNKVFEPLTSLVGSGTAYSESIAIFQDYFAAEMPNLPTAQNDWVYITNPKPTQPVDPSRHFDPYAWQNITPTPGATQVTNGTELVSAVGAASPGDVIELAAAGAYTLIANLSISKQLTINAIVEGAYIDGNKQIQNAANAIITFNAIEFRQSDSVRAIMFLDGTLTMNRCKFNRQAANNLIAIDMLTGAKALNLNSCIFVGNTTTYVVRNAVAGCVATAKNCLICTTLGSAIGFYQSSGTFNCYNCAVSTPGNDFYGAIGGDYNASADATAPGANSQKNITWANEFDASFHPLVTSSLYNLGDNANKADRGFYGMPTLNPPQIGAVTPDFP